MTDQQRHNFFLKPITNFGQSVMGFFNIKTGKPLKGIPVIRSLVTEFRPVDRKLTIYKSKLFSLLYCIKLIPALINSVNRKLIC